MNEAIVLTTPDQIRRYHLLALIGALKLEQKGMRHSKGSALKVAKQRTGPKTNDREKQIAKLREMADET